MLRYHRQIILPQIGNDGQKRLFDSKVLIIGAGGLAHPATQYLSAMGVGHIQVLDGDKVSVSNLQRQILFNQEDIGRNKAETLAKKLAILNSDVRVTFKSVFLDRDLALKIFNDFDLVLDCTDNFESKFLINDVCALYDKPMIFGAISQFEGQVGIFWKSKGSCYRCFYPGLPKSKIQNCAESGVIGPVVGVIGSLQAMEAMKVLVARDELSPLVGQIHFYNFSDHSFRHLQIPRRLTCPCHEENYSKSQISEIENPLCSTDPATLLIDVREKEEWDEYHIVGSHHFPLSNIERGHMPDLSKDLDIVLICKAGGRAKRAAELFQKADFRNARASMKGVYEYQT